MPVRILSIDDDEDILYTMQEICQSQGWVPLLARSFAEAEQLIRIYGSCPLDLILLDYHLPHLDGIHVVRRLRSMGLQSPILILTIEEEKQVMEEFLAAGADDYAIKPVKLVDLISRIHAHLRYRQQGSQGEMAFGSPELEKGINKTTLSVILQALQGRDYMDISQLQAATQLNAKTIHRYLLYLVREHQVDTQNTYGKRGRPKVRYRWRGESFPFLPFFGN